MSKTLTSALDKVSGDLVGRSISYDEQKMLLSRFTYELFPLHLIEILKEYNIVGQTFSISEDDNPSGIEVEMKWFTPIEQVGEAFDYYPGLLVFKEGYLPVGMCLMGSGDSYFLKNKDGKDMLFRVPHDAIEDDLFDYDSVELICELVDLFDYLSEQ